MKTYLRYVDLRSDTFTKPTDAMLDAMRNAESGDDCYGEDSSVNQLQDYTAKYFGKEAALYFPTGTMTNVVAMRALINPGEEVILDKSYHENFFESAQMANFAGAVLNPCKTKDGILTVEKLKKVIDSKCRSSVLYTKPKIVVVENTINSHGGKVFPLDKLKELYEFTSQNGIILYMDGARLFNACVASGRDPEATAKEYAKYVDCMAVCLSKGLGAPMGSMLLGKKEVIERAKIYRKRFGGSFHQAGYMAATGLYAIQHNVNRLKEDHDHISLMACGLQALPGIKIVNAETNMVLFDVQALGVNAQKFVAMAKERGLLLIAWQENVVRIVTHLNVSGHDVLRAMDILSYLVKELNLPLEQRAACDPKPAVNLLLEALKSKGVPCEQSETNPQIIRIKDTDKAREFYNLANSDGLDVNVCSKDVVELVVTAEHEPQSLQKIAEKLAILHQLCHKPVFASTNTSIAGNINHMFAASANTASTAHVHEDITITLSSLSK